MRFIALASAVVAALTPQSVIAQEQPHQHGHHGHGMHQSDPIKTTVEPEQKHHSHGHHDHGMGPAGSTYDLRFIDGMVEHHTGALRMSEYVFNIGAPGVGALANSIWNEQAREIKAMRQWRKAWYPEAPIFPVALRPNGDPNAMADLVRMSPEAIAAMRMTGTKPTRENRVQWFLEGMIEHHGGALQMAHEARKNSTNPTILRFAREIIVAQRKEIIELRKMLQSRGINQPAYYKFDDLFAL
ncbi:DUF305 domain-containing protein [Synechococcus sp. AH-551-E05]|nr:DUF305 domain-containing protein [Synechococcus sp. AH-551-E05]MDB4651229.1 DUF305 domain-containing protein [Synechococcus sp. AH-551-E05]